MAIEYNFTLDMDRSKRDNNIAYARTGDVDSIVINADLVFNGAAYTPSGTSAFFECVTPNGRSIRAAAEMTGSSVSVDVPPAAFQAAGVINVAYFRFESGDASNPAYVESTEPFAIVVREGIGDNIDAGDYIEEWRKLADKLETIVADVEQKAEQAETAINEQKTEVDQLKAQAQKAIAGDVTDVEEAAQSAISAINQEKADVADAAEGITEAGKQAINTFNVNSQQAIGQFNTDGTAAIDQFNTDADGKLGEVDDMITEAQGDVDAAITQLETATDKAVSAMEDALDGTTAGSIQNAINRTLKLDVADMTDIPSNSSLSSFTNVGSYCCKTAATAATVGDCPIDDSPFNMYVFSSATSGHVMQLAVPIDLNGKPTAEWHVRFGTSSAMDPWSVIGGGADIAAGLGIDVTGDAKKTVSLDTTAFYEHVGPSYIISGSTEATGGGRNKEVRIKGKTWANRWPVINSQNNGVTVSTDETGLITVTGDLTTPTSGSYNFRDVHGISANKRITALCSRGLPDGMYIYVAFRDSDSAVLAGELQVGFSSTSETQKSATVPANTASIIAGVAVKPHTVLSSPLSFRVMLVEGSEAPDCFTPPASITSVKPTELVTAGRNLVNTDGALVLQGNYGVALPDLTLQPGSYTVKSPSGLTGNLAIYMSGDTSSVIAPITESGRSFTITSPVHGLDFRSAEANMITLGNISQFQLELGSTATAYEPPNVTTTTLPEVELRSLPDGTADELVIDVVGTVTVNREVAKINADSPGWTDFVNTGTTKYISTSTFSSAQSSAFVNLQSNIAVSTELVADDTLDVPRFACNRKITFFRIPSTEPPTKLSEMVEYMRELGAYCYAPVEQTTESLGTVQTPQLPAPTFNMFHDSQVPSDIEAEVVKVDYLPPSDAYTREEVDKKINDAGMPDVVPVSNGGTGVTTAAAERNRLGLGNTTGALPIANGGTGASTAAAALSKLVYRGVVEASTDWNSLLDGIYKVASVDGPNGPNGDHVLAKPYGFGVAICCPSDADGSAKLQFYIPNDATGNAALDKSITSRQLWGGNWYPWVSINYNARVASMLRNARTFLVNLASTSAASFDGSADVQPGVTGILHVANGGTGSTSAKAAQNSLLNDMNVSSDALTDGSMLVGYNTSPSASNGAVHKRSVSTVWNYIAGKIRSTFGFSSDNVLPVSHGGTGLTDNPSILVNLGSESTTNVLASSPRPGVTGTLPVSHGGTGATAPGVDMLSNLGITFGTAEPPSTGTPGSIYIQYFE